MNKRKICVITGSRAEYGLLYSLIQKIEKDEDLELQLVITGMHLSREFGLTCQEIQKDFRINKRIKMNLNSDTSFGISSSMAKAQPLFSKAYNQLNPDIIVILGDRYEIFTAACAAMIGRVPIAHIHGGEATEGLIDEAIRHSITKMSHLHFTSTEKYRSRVIQLGESPNKVYNFGSLGVENTKNFKVLRKNEIEKSLNFKFNSKNILITYHPVTLEKNSSKKNFNQLLEVVDELENTNIIFTKSNSDHGGKIVNQMIDKYTALNSQKSKAFFSLGQLRYLSVLKHVDVIIGNSSSGIYEAPSYKIGTIDIGDRQKGRIKGKSVISCSPKKESIKAALKKIYSKNFQKELKNSKNIYEGNFVSKKIKNVLKTVELDNILKKNFYNLKVKL